MLRPAAGERYDRPIPSCRFASMIFPWFCYVFPASADQIENPRRPQRISITTSLLSWLIVNYMTRRPRPCGTIDRYSVSGCPFFPVFPIHWGDIANTRASGLREPDRIEYRLTDGLLILTTGPSQPIYCTDCLRPPVRPQSFLYNTIIIGDFKRVKTEMGE